MDLILNTLSDVAELFFVDQLLLVTDFKFSRVFRPCDLVCLFVMPIGHTTVLVALITRIRDLGRTYLVDEHPHNVLEELRLVNVVGDDQAVLVEDESVLVLHVANRHLSSIRVILVKSVQAEDLPLLRVHDTVGDFALVELYLVDALGHLRGFESVVGYGGQDGAQFLGEHFFG